jgi:amino acid adenylation domain-containing protein
VSFLLPQLIDRTADRHPDREAVRFAGSGLAYAQLREKSDCLARLLIERGVRRRDRVGIYSNKSLESAVAMYGIMKAGAAYVPLDPTAPVERIATIIRNCGIECMISQDAKAGQLQQVKQLAEVRTVVGVTENGVSWDEVWQCTGNDPDVGTIEQDLAYIIYTSGSTGEPKGIMHTHHSGLSFARWAAAAYALTCDDRLSNHAPLHFDLSIFDFFAGAVAGATTVIVPEPVTKFPASYSQLLQNERVTVFFTVPFALIQLDSHGVLEDRNLSALRWVIFGGEPMLPKNLRSLMGKIPSARFDNMYGPSEVNGCSHYTIPDAASLGDDAKSIPIPIPIGTLNANMEGIVVDDDDNEVERGQPGVLLVRSPTMMQGYWGRKDLNAHAFYRRPVATAYDDVFYRTGDIVQQQADGNLQFLGRKDRQIKIRGYRVELDEVESALAGHPAVEEAGAFALPDGSGSNRIEVAVTLIIGADVTALEMVTYAKSQLAWYAVPDKVTVQALLPRTTSGKIDRKQLREDAMALPNASD